mgnify:FL=1
MADTKNDVNNPAGAESGLEHLKHSYPAKWYVPEGGLGTRLLEIRKRYIESGGKLYTLDEINDEVQARRG